MDILDLLADDHDRMREELVSVRRSLDQHDLRNKIKAFISGFEAHEGIEEDILFPALPDMPREMAARNQDMHDKIWILLDQVVQMMGRADFRDLQQAFFKFHACLEQHLQSEERGLFPAIRLSLDAKALEALGKKAEERLKHLKGAALGPGRPQP